MPSRLSIETHFESSEVAAPVFSPNSRPSSPPQKKQKMSLSQTYFIAASARTKLGREACKSDHNLRLLVGHANLLDSLMLDLHQAEREQEAWFNQTVQKAAKVEEPRHIQWMDTLQDDDDDEELDDAASDTPSDSSDDEEDYEFAVQPLRRIRSPPVHVTAQELDEDEELEDYEDDEEHALVRTVSGQSTHQPPELVDDSDSDDESPPQSPPQATIEFPAEQQKTQAIVTTNALLRDKSVIMTGTEEADFVESGYFLSGQHSSPLIAAC